MLIEGNTLWFSKLEEEALLRIDPELFAILGHMSLYDIVYESACAAEAASVEEFTAQHGRSPEFFELVLFQDTVGQRYMAIEVDDDTKPALKTACELIGMPEACEEPDDIRALRRTAAQMLKNFESED